MWLNLLTTEMSETDTDAKLTLMDAKPTPNRVTLQTPTCHENFIQETVEVKTPWAAHHGTKVTMYGCVACISRQQSHVGLSASTPSAKFYLTCVILRVTCQIKDGLARANNTELAAYEFYNRTPQGPFLGSKKDTLASMGFVDVLHI